LRKDAERMRIGVIGIMDNLYSILARKMELRTREIDIWKVLKGL
jgi:hypothetical protein